LRTLRPVGVAEGQVVERLRSSGGWLGRKSLTPRSRGGHRGSPSSGTVSPSSGAAQSSPLLARPASVTSFSVACRRAKRASASPSQTVVSFTDGNSRLSAAVEDRYAVVEQV